MSSDRIPPKPIGASSFTGKTSRRWRTPAFRDDHSDAIQRQGLGFLEAALVVDEMAPASPPSMGRISAVIITARRRKKKLAANLVLDGDDPTICITEPDAGSAATK